MGEVSPEQVERVRRALGRKLTGNATTIRATATMLRGDQGMYFLSGKESKALGKAFDQLDAIAKHFDTLGKRLT